MNYIRGWKHDFDDCTLFIGVDNKYRWYVEYKGKMFKPTLTSTDPIWFDNRKWSKTIVENFGVDEAGWNKVRQEIQQIEKDLENDLKKNDNESPEWVKKEASEVMEQGGTVEYIIETFKTLHQGDLSAGKLVYCCQFTPHIENSKGLHPKTTGESGKGKSALVEAVIHTMPEEWYLKASLSSKALFYNDVKPGTLIFCDDYKQNEDIDTIIKQTTSRFHKPYNYLSVDRADGTMKGRDLSIPEELVWAITSVDSDQDLQVLNRAVPLDVDDSPDTDEKVANNFLILAKTGEDDLPETEEVMVCREILRVLKSKRYRVKVPYADRIIWRDQSNRRNLPMFLDIIMALAFWNQFDRETDDDGHLLASEEDFNEAKLLYCGETRKDSFKSKLTAQEMKLAMLIRDAGGKLSRQDAIDKMKVSAGRIDQLTRGKMRSGERKGGLEQKITGFTIEQESNTIRYDDSTSKTVRVTMFNLGDGFDIWNEVEDVVSLSPVPVVTDTRRYPRDTLGDTHKTRSSNNKDTIHTHIEGYPGKSKDGGKNDEKNNSFSQGGKEGILGIYDSGRPCDRVSLGYFGGSENEKMGMLDEMKQTLSERARKGQNVQVSDLMRMGCSELEVLEALDAGGWIEGKRGWWSPPPNP